jgi:hypothetical protein
VLDGIHDKGTQIHHTAIQDWARPQRPVLVGAHTPLQPRRLHQTLEQQRQIILCTAAADEILAKICLVEISI